MHPALVIYLVYSMGFCAIQGLALMWQDEHIANLTPIGLYNNTKMNWFGCIFCWLGEIIISPIWWITIGLAYLVYYIWQLFYFLFTFGRK